MSSKSKPDLKKLKEALKIHKTIPIRVVTGSMEPVIRTGEQLILREITEPLKIFDIIVFWNGTIFICHYVWRINSQPNPDGDRWIVTRSLVSRWEDFPVLESKILGRVEGPAIPLWRKLLIALRARFRG